MEVVAMPRKMVKGRLFTGGRKERPRLRWMDEVVADLTVTEIKQWTEKAKDRGQRRLAVEEACADHGS
jgi:hypothetical protein